ncbi:hypothetical protein MJH12_18860, partial [bacterium]|nr:hypothetical protein [bacterium]
MNEKYRLVRAMRQTKEDFDVFIKTSVVAVGWSDINFSQYQDKEALVNEVVKQYYSDGDTVPQVVGKKKNEVRRFFDLKIG